MDPVINSLKETGNAALNKGQYNDAIQSYSKALELDKNNYLIYSNRSAAYMKLNKYEEALKDAEKTIELNDKFVKGYSRKGAAFTCMKRYSEAYESYAQGLQIEPDNKALLTAQNELKEILLKELVNETPMDIDPQSPLSAAGGDGPSVQKKAKNQTEKSKVINSDDADDKNLPANKREAKKCKEFGNAAYKKKDFHGALIHYKKAIENDPTDITFYNNIAAVYMEQKEYENCLAECEKAVEIGRENRADYKLIAKALARMGNVHKKLNNWKIAKVFYEKAMSEHRTPELRTALSEIEKKIKEEERMAYIDPVKAEEEKEIGNELFKNGDYSTAIKHYTEAISRNPDDPKLYSNRAACYTKLLEFNLGLKDCEKCIELDGTFIKGWVRKGRALQGLKQSSKALTAFQKALELDPTNAEALEGYRSCTMAVHSNPEEIWKKAMSDPEIQQILKDPAMRLILEQMQNDPKAVQDHIKNPAIAEKIQKLLESGIIKIH